MASAKRPLEDRFWEKVKKTSGCWHWTSAKNHDGHGVIWVGNGRSMYAHRLSVMLDGQKIPKGRVIDHICRNRACVKPAHLRIVTTTVNALENSESICVKQAAKTHCSRGHALLSGNLIKFSDGRKVRSCLTCARIRSRKYYWAAKKEAK